MLCNKLPVCVVILRLDQEIFHPHPDAVNHMGADGDPLGGTAGQLGRIRSDDQTCTQMPFESRHHTSPNAWPNCLRVQQKIWQKHWPSQAKKLWHMAHAFLFDFVPR